MSKPTSTRAIAAAALSGLLCLTTIAHSAAAVTSRVEECKLLEHQLQHELITHAKARRAAEARVLQGKARKLCASERQAQGIRTYADALKLLGLQPVGDDRPIPKAHKPNGVEK
jgi:hypothetical protein